MKYITTTLAALTEFYKAVLKPYALPPDAQQALISHLIDANLRGVDSHGLQQIIGYTKSLQSGRINPQAEITQIETNSSPVLLDGDSGIGQYVACVAMRLAVDLAKESGLAFVGVKNSNHFGVAGYYTRIAAEAGFISFATSDTNVVDLAPHGGIQPRIGNNPHSWAIPVSNREPIVLDMACATVSGGKIRHYGFQDLSIPNDWACTASGNRTTNPNEAAFNLPGTFKAAGLALIMDILCGPLLGTVSAFFKDKAVHNAANGTGHAFIVIDPGNFTEKHLFDKSVKDLIAAYKSTPTKDGAHDILIPGEKECLTCLQRQRNGIPVPVALIDHLKTIYGEKNTSLLQAPASFSA